MSRLKIVLVLILLLVFATSITVLQAQQMGGMPDAASPTDLHFGETWRQAMARLNLNQDQMGRLASVLQGASARLDENWTALQDLLQREAKAVGDGKANLRKRIGLADSERDLIVENVYTDLKDFLTQQQADLVMAGAFHGVSRAHSEQAMPMTMGMGTGMKMQPMNDLEDLMMRLAAAALPLNEGFRAGSLAEILKELAPGP